MAESFDPYHVWLGIPPEDQPPNHYRLLGIRPFESNPDVIDNMADQRMTHLRTFQTGKNGKLSQKLLNEVAAARLCLLGEKTKREYDEKLRATLATASPGVRARMQEPRPAAVVSAASSPRPGTPQTPSSVPASRDSLRRATAGAAAPSSPAQPEPEAVFEATPSPPGPIGGGASRRKSVAPQVVGGAVALVLIIGLGVAYAVIHESQSPTDQNDSPAPPTIATTSTDTKTPKQTEPRKQSAPAVSTLVVQPHTAAGDEGSIKLSIDGQEVAAKAGQPWEFPSTPGQHRLKAVRPGFEPYEINFLAATGQRQTVDLEWKRLTMIRFNWPPADRTGAQLTIDGEMEPLNAAELQFPVPPGQHQIRIVRRGFRVQAITISVAAGTVRTMIPVWNPVAPRPAIAQAPPLANAGQPIDLLALCDPQAPGVRGMWKKEGGALISDRTHPAIIPISLAPRGDYKITMVVERIEGYDSIAMGLVHNGHVFSAGVDHFPDRGGLSGVEMVDGRRVDQTPAHHEGHVLVNGRQSTLVFTVLKDHFLLAQDGQTLVDWPNADYGRCTLFGPYAGVDRSKLFIATWSSSYRISRLELTPLGWRPDATAVAAQTVKPPQADEQPEKPGAKAAVPNQAAQAASMKSIQDIYRDDIKRATTPELKIELAKKLRAAALGTDNDPAGRYVLFKMASDLAAAGGDLDTATDTIDKVAETFNVDPLDAKAEMLIALSKQSQHPDSCSAKLNELADAAVAADRYDLAKKSVVAALAVKDPAARKQTAAHQREINEIEAESHRIKTALETLKTSPDDPDANLAVGKFNCLVKGNFDSGLPQLAKGSDKTLAELAKLDLSKPIDIAQRLKVADGWWETGKRPARLRAKAMYEEMRTTATGLALVKIEKRLQDFESKAGVDPWTNLVALTDPDKNAVRGKWTKSADGLQSSDIAWGQIVAAPFDPGANYEVRAEFTRLTGNNDVMLILPVADKQLRLALGVNDRWGGLDRIDSLVVSASTKWSRPAQVVNNKRYLVDVVVRTTADGSAAEVFVRVNGVDFVSFQGQTAELTGLPYGWRLPNSSWIGLGANNATVLFSAVQCRKLPPRTGGR